MSVDWKKRWVDGQIGFHQPKFHPMLEKYAAQFSKGKILVPLCGKTLDMIYLANAGHAVVGVELSPLACRDFFVENKIDFSEEQAKDFIIFESKSITLYCGDFFNLPQNIWDGITGIYDRAALIALPPEVRIKYANEIKSRTSEKLEMLLITFEYQQALMDGPPFSVLENEVQQHYQTFHFEKLSTTKDEAFSKRRVELNSINFFESVYWLTKN